jgi:hypothetical protein
MGILSYTVRARRDAAQIKAHFQGGEILVDLPMALVGPWANTDQIGIEYVQPISEKENLRIVIEKDFRCLQPRSEEDESDNFPHPQ